jgi:hypothetical protein
MWSRRGIEPRAETGTERNEVLPMQEKTSDSQAVIVLNRSVVELLRHALYTRLERDPQDLDETLLIVPDRAADRKVWAANMRLARTASLLDRTGWTYQEQRAQVKLGCVEDVALAVSVLRDDLETESNVKAAALSDNAEAEVLASSRRELAIYDALIGLEAMAATAGLLLRERAASA